MRFRPFQKERRRRACTRAAVDIVGVNRFVVSIGQPCAIVRVCSDLVIVTNRLVLLRELLPVQALRPTRSAVADLNSGTRVRTDAALKLFADPELERWLRLRQPPQLLRLASAHSTRLRDKPILRSSMSTRSTLTSISSPIVYQVFGWILHFVIGEFGDVQQPFQTIFESHKHAEVGDLGNLGR